MTEPEPDLSALTPEDIAWFDEHCSGTGAPGRDRARYLREQALVEQGQEREREQD